MSHLLQVHRIAQLVCSFLVAVSPPKCPQRGPQGFPRSLVLCVIRQGMVHSASLLATSNSVPFATSGNLVPVLSLLSILGVISKVAVLS